MYMQVLRTTEADVATEGKMTVDDVQECYTLEDTDRKLEDGGTKVYGKTAIPRGSYRVKISFSSRFQKYLLEVLDVPQFTGVRIHPGNSAKDTEGCILVGSVNTQDDDNWIGGSRIAYNKLHDKVENAIGRGEEIMLEIV